MLRIQRMQCRADARFRGPAERNVAIYRDALAVPDRGLKLDSVKD